MEEPASVTEISGIRLRRAIVGVLLVTRFPMTIEQVDRAMGSHALSPAVSASARSAGAATVRRAQHKAIAEVLRYQASLGRVRRVQRGLYEAMPDGMSRSMRDRCVRSLRNVGEPRGGGGAWAVDD